MLIEVEAVWAPPASEVIVAEDMAAEDMPPLFVLEAGMLGADISEPGAEAEDITGPAGDEAGILAEFVTGPAEEADIMLV